MQGELGQLYESWRVQLIKASSLVEAYIDFPDEDLPTNVIKELREVVDSLINTIDEHLNDNRKGEILRNGLHITILGAPNVGKSSLLNLLAKREVAIVSNIAGTTRDIIEVNLDIAGYLVTLADTAGIREDADIIEKEGIKRALDKAGYTDLKLVLFDASLLPDLDPFTLKLIDDKTIILFNKTDIAKEALPENIHGIKPLGVAIEKNIGVDELLNLLKDYVTKELGTSSAPVLTRVRHRQNLQECQKSLQHFTLDKDIELAAEDLRMACVYLGRITGKIDVDTILGEIFSNFCIGK
jgi:tRNA modification GTPase